MRKPQVNREFLPYLPLHLIFETWFLVGPGAGWFGWSGWLESPTHKIHLYLLTPRAGISGAHLHTWFFHEFYGFEL